ncbi:NUDIX domain-containing protein [Paenibacillus sp. MABNR03]
MTGRIVVTGGAIIRDDGGRILLQRRSDYGDWGLPGGGMEPGERIEET